MTTLNWLEVAELRLTDKLIPDPNEPSELRQQLRGVRVAVDGALLHVDPRAINLGEKRDDQEDYEVHVIPASAVEVMRYRVLPSQPRVRFM